METIEEGYANGLELPDRITERFPGNDTFPAHGYILRRESLPMGNRWVTDSIPGHAIPSLRHVPDSLVVLEDAQGRVVERREYRRGLFTHHHTVWGPWGSIVEIDSAGAIGQPARQVSWDTTHWSDGEIAHRIATRRYDTSVTIRDSTAWESGRVVFSQRYRISPVALDTLTCTWSFSIDTAGDTATLETCGDQRRSWKSGPPSAPRERRRGDTITVDFGEDGGTRYVYLDSSEGRPPLLLELAIYDCLQGTCRDESRTESTYAVLQEATSTKARSARSDLRVQRNGLTASWSGRIADGAKVRLQSPDGSLVASGLFREGSASLPLPPASAPLLWTARHQGRLLGSGFLPAR